NNHPLADRVRRFARHKQTWPTRFHQSRLDIIGDIGDREDDKISKTCRRRRAIRRIAHGFKKFGCHFISTVRRPGFFRAGLRQHMQEGFPCLGALPLIGFIDRRNQFRRDLPGQRFPGHWQSFGRVAIDEETSDMRAVIRGDIEPRTQGALIRIGPCQRNQDLAQSHIPSPWIALQLAIVYSLSPKRVLMQVKPIIFINRGGMEALREKLHAGAQTLLAPFINFLVRFAITPNQISVAGLLINFITAWLIVAQLPVAAGILYGVAGLFDLMDGALARKTGQAHPFGAFLDSTLDRVSEGVVFAAIAYHFAVTGEAIAAAAVVLALLGSLLVSYTRARAEALGCVCRGGFAARLERLLLILFALIFGFVEIAIYLLLAATAFTVCQRIWITYRQLNTSPPAA
ncbi:MAG TPA: hypothetical protein DCF61_03985, partial [Alphaproteobacteria bacterium]|nr:hypothetical protein [Alphaproteobacteria bacterium]